MTKKVFAVAAHPDDIELMMAGTLFQLRDAGCELHYMNIANGDCGSAEYDRPTLARVRREEAMQAARFLKAQFHESLCSDLEIFYDTGLLKRMTAVIREVKPDILLVHYPFDYMEDHCNASRLAVGAAFCRGMMNFVSEPSLPPILNDVTVYHAMPHGMRDMLGRRVEADFFVNISPVIELKQEMLSQHRSQKEWLDVSQGMDSYLLEMRCQAEKCGRASGKYKHAEGWIRHNHLGFCAADANPLAELLQTAVCAVNHKLRDDNDE
ncbi:MAG: PIG-L family deacetylase [Victivallales bacterium]|nr:PIG-L family deacetylase [Victivallales bacterium]